jgi:hypothetical protein
MIARDRVRGLTHFHVTDRSRSRVGFTPLKTDYCTSHNSPKALHAATSDPGRSDVGWDKLALERSPTMCDVGSGVVGQRLKAGLSHPTTHRSRDITRVESDWRPLGGPPVFVARVNLPRCVPAPPSRTCVRPQRRWRHLSPWPYSGPRSGDSCRSRIVAKFRPPDFLAILLARKRV